MAKTNAASLTKKDAVRKALAELGSDAKPVQIQGFVKERFGITMTTDHISTTKGEIHRKEAGKGKAAAAKPAQAKPLEAVAAKETKPAPRAETPRANGISLTDIEAVKGLVGRVGPEGLKKLIDLLAR